MRFFRKTIIAALLMLILSIPINAQGSLMPQSFSDSINGLIISGILLNAIIPESITDYHSKEYHCGFSWEVPVQYRSSSLGDTNILLVPAYNYFPKDKTKGGTFTIYCNPFTPGDEQSYINHYFGGGFIKDSYGYGPKFDYRLNIGPSYDVFFAGFFMNLSYAINHDMRFRRFLLSTGLEFYL